VGVAIELKTIRLENTFVAKAIFSRLKFN